MSVYREPIAEDTELAGSELEPEGLEAQLDTILAKVAKHGRASLSERENKILLKASEIYKQRRK